MPVTFQDEEFVRALAQARRPRRIAVSVGAPEGKHRHVPKPFPSPIDWRDHWIYFVMVDRFNNPRDKPHELWDRALDGRQGGTLEGLRQQLEYIKQLGAGAIWLTPVLKNPQVPANGSYHGYGIQDFTRVDPRLGSSPDMAEAELERLVDEAHARGLYVILDIVINHAGNVFVYETSHGEEDQAEWSEEPYKIEWRGPNGAPDPHLMTLPAPEELPLDAAVWPKEFQRNDWFRRQGTAFGVRGDFFSLKEFRTELPDEYGDKPVWNLLIRAYQYVIARYDIDGFRVDTLKHVERDFAMTFCNAMREFALSIGKRNFFIYGECRDADESLLADYTGRYASEDPDTTGADAALDFPLEWRLANVAKGFDSPAALRELFALRKRVHEQKGLLSTHGDASRFYVTVLDNHDDPNRFLYPRYGGNWTDQLTMTLGCLFTLQGVPCVYYGTEQGLKGTVELYDGGESRPENVREALWGKPQAFDRRHPVYNAIERLSEVRAREPALRYGRQYFRPVSGNDVDFGHSTLRGGVIAFSRILGAREVVVVANTSTTQSFNGQVLVDGRLNLDGAQFEVVFSNLGHTGSGTARGDKGTVRETDGSVVANWARRIPVSLAPMEFQVLARP